MIPCRLKIITANINEDAQISDTEVIKYISQCINPLKSSEADFLKQSSQQQPEEEEKNMEKQNEDEDEDVVIIFDKNDLVKKKRIKISKEKVYLIDGLFSSTNMSSNKPNKKSNQTRETKKLRSSQNNTSSLNNLNSHKKKEYLYKCENVHDNKVNTFYMSRLNQKNQKKQGGAQEKNENPFAYNFYKANKDINSNIAGLYDYKNKIKELMKEEPKKIENRDNIVKENKYKIDNLLKENTKLNYELGCEINREDELKGEIIILNNQYKLLLNELTNEEKKIKEYQDIIKHKSIHEKIISNKQTDIVNYYNNLNECLTNGEILLITKPDSNNQFNYINSKNVENNLESNDEKEIQEKNNIIKVDIELQNENIQLDIIKKFDENEEINNYINNDIITFLLKGYFINMNITNVNDAVDKIWIKEKPIQTFETITEELLILINDYINEPNSSFINGRNRNLLMNYLYSFCNCYNYMTVNEFKSVFHDKIGNFIVNDNINLINKLYNYCDGKLSEFMQTLQNIDRNKTGKIDLHDFVKVLKEKNLLFKNINHNNIIEQNDINDVIQLLIIQMKNNHYNLFKSNNNLEQNNLTNLNKDNNNEIINTDISKQNLSIYDLYYEPIINLIKNNSKSESPLYKGIIKKYLIDNKMNSMMNFLEPLLEKNENNNIIINKGLDRYIKSQTFVEFLITNNVIAENEKFLLPYENDILLDINQIANEFDQASPLMNNFEENKENIINDIINNMSDK
jgi:hypothetical protein